MRRRMGKKTLITEGYDVMIDLERLKSEALRAYDIAVRSGQVTHVPEVNGWGVQRRTIIRHIEDSIPDQGHYILRFRMHKIEIPMWRSSSSINGQITNPDKIFLRYGKDGFDSMLVIKEDSNIRSICDS